MLVPEALNFLDSQLLLITDSRMRFYFQYGLQSEWMGQKIRLYGMVDQSTMKGESALSLENKME